MICKQSSLATLVLMFVGVVLAGDSFVELPSKNFTYESASAPLTTVLGEFNKQTGIAIATPRADGNRPIRVQCVASPFWNALEQIAHESNLRIVFGDGGRAIQLEPNSDTKMQPPTSIDRIFRVCARRVQSNIDLETGSGKTVVTLGLNWQPGFSAFLIEAPGKSIVAVDDQNQHLLSNDSSRMRLVVSDAQVDLPLSFVHVSRSAKNIKQLNGSIGMIGAEKMLQFDLGQVGDGKEQTQEKVAVHASAEFAEASRIWTVRVELGYPENGVHFDSHEATCWLANNTAWLVNSDGKTKLECNGGYELISATNRSANLIYRFVNEPGRKLGKPSDWSLHIQTPSPLISTQVKFKLENITLP